MLFNSSLFAVFLPVVLVLFFLTPARLRWALLLLASYYFYACWRVEYLGLIWLSTVVDYWAARKMSAQADRLSRRPYLILSLVANLGLLFFYKYFNFTMDSVQAVVDSLGIMVKLPYYNILLPVGISFYTFQTLSYSIDVYRGDRKAELHFGYFALYVSYFPQLVAGPIERSTRLLPQLRQPQRFDYARMVSGLRLMLWGFFKKLVIADNAAVFVNTIYENPHEFSGFQLLIGTYLFAFQIYCDFSGYSDIAIGTSRIMGYDLMKNFRRPYFSRSIAEFWSRWHISLSSWFRDYLYISLGGNRTTKAKWFRNLILVFLISGLWHGANWTFVVWGALHGFYLVSAIGLAPLRKAVSGWFAGLVARSATGSRLYERSVDLLAMVMTFHLVVLAWVFFRAGSVTEAWLIISRIFTEWGQVSLGGIGQPFPLLVTVAAIVFMELVHIWERQIDLEEKMSISPVPVRWALYYVLIFALLIFGNFESSEFIYFQF